MTVKEIRSSVQAFLASENFIKRLGTDYITFKEEKNKQNTTLRSVSINGLPKDRVFWEIKLEDDIRCFSPKDGKKVEGALAFFVKKKLYIILIEMKTTISLNPKSDIKDKGARLDEIKDKLTDSIHRFNFLLTLDNHHDKHDFEEKVIRFVGVIFYRQLKESITQDNNKLNTIINSAEKKGLFECEDTGLGKNKIPVIFIEQDSEHITIPFSDLEARVQSLPL